jgi:general secretion pathway protein I
MSGRCVNRIAGFSLLEVLVALSILALSYGMILQLLGSSSRNALRASDYRQAIMVAESQLNLAATVRNPAILPSSGEAGEKFAWRLDIAPAVDLAMSDAVSMYTPLRLTVEVSWEQESREPANITLSTIRLGSGNVR